MALDLLLSGFAPFDGASVNESWEAVRGAVPRLEEIGLEVSSLLLPVEFGRAGEVLLEEVRRQRPAVVIAAGLAAGRPTVTPERVAINVRDARIPDAAHRSPVDEPCAPDGPAAYFTTLPIKAMTQAARVGGVDAQVSQTAGTYVCNDVFYLLQHALATDPDLAGVRGGFVHVPLQADVSIPASAQALALMAAVAVSTPQDSAIAAGAEH